jgi:hypothetical protein
MMQSGECEREIVLDADFREEISLKKTSNSKISGIANKKRLQDRP